MKGDEVYKYWLPACLNLYGADPEKYNPYKAIPTSGYKVITSFIRGTYHYELLLDEALGIAEYQKLLTTSFEEDQPMTEELKRLLVLLAGPNGKTILKIYRIQKGLEK